MPCAFQASLLTLFLMESDIPGWDYDDGVGSVRQEETVCGVTNGPSDTTTLALARQSRVLGFGESALSIGPAFFFSFVCLHPLTLARLSRAET